ncbi:MAG TPA: DUF4258 domain-containing protein [Candidatus Methanoperedens sp.]|nr:DUF4258 domain-containing protein [Candidatus Methanoperedens sp.]
MFKFSEHARKRMISREISEEDVIAAIENGELEFTRIDEKGRGTEYTHSIELKDPFWRKIMVGWTYDGDDFLILTLYEIKRK